MAYKPSGHLKPFRDWHIFRDDSKPRFNLQRRKVKKMIKDSITYKAFKKFPIKSVFAKGWIQLNPRDSRTSKWGAIKISETEWVIKTYNFECVDGYLIYNGRRVYKERICDFMYLTPKMISIYIPNSKA